LNATQVKCCNLEASPVLHGLHGAYLCILFFCLNFYDLKLWAVAEIHLRMEVVTTWSEIYIA